ncbi:uncharacterized protein BDV17DRAFT_296623 [Aspergillus undulatus]|uniref:uncharacterized protein n=1 Tax=Aspergillus undulatus TaxID=1810928 RepID=UPI003CCD7E66
MTKIALFGSTGQIGRSILFALLKTTPHSVIQVVRPESESKAKDVDVKPDQKQRLTTISLDPIKASEDELVSVLNGVEIVISALNGKALAAQGKIQDAADKAGVKRFYPSEYGMHHLYTDDQGRGVLHPTWNMKSEANMHALHHPAIAAGRMTYTLIGCGDFYNQDREATWCPWTQRDAPSYTLHIVGNADAKADFTHIDDLATFLVKTIENPAVSENANLNVVSDHISYNELAALLEKYSGKKVEKVVYPLDAMHRAWKDPEDIPEAVKGKSAFPDDFWMLVKGMQGQNRFWRPPGEVHNGLFPELEVTTFEKYFRQQFGARG